jgi:glycosyltransferase involved in cell wall biosynthesis
MPRLFICTPTASLQGGVERILESLAAHLPPRGFEVTFGLARGARFHDPDAFRRAYRVVRGVDVDGTSGSMYGRRRALRKAIVEANPDLVLIARMFDAYPVCSELKREGHPLRLAVTVQAYEANYFVDLARYAEFVDLCVTSGELIAAAVRKLTPFPPDRVRSIPGGVAPARRFRAVHAGPLRIGYVGRLEQKQKRILDLPLLAEALSRRGIACTWTVAGGGADEEPLRAAMPNARFLGWVSTAELYDRVFPDLDLLVHFAEWEGVTIAPREAMAHGVVPVISRFPGLAIEGQFLDGTNALTFPVGDVGAAADAVERLHRDRELLERLSQAARGSQGGVRSELGAIDAWAEGFRDALALPVRVGATVPRAPRDQGLLSALPAAVAEVVRRMRGSAATSAAGEWPHWSAIPDRALMDAVAAFARGETVP